MRRSSSPASVPTHCFSSSGAKRADPEFSSRLYRVIAGVIASRLRRRQEEWFQEDAGVGELPVFEDGFEALRTATLPPLVVDAIEGYRRVGDPQRAFLYRWAWHGLGVTCLDVVADEWREHVQITKLLMVELLEPDEIVARIEASGVEEGLLEEMRAHRRRVAEIVERAKAIDLRAYARAMEEVLAMELAARGLL